MRIAIGCDHAAFEEKEKLRGFLEELGHSVIDCGPSSNDRVNYPDYAKKVVNKVQAEDCDKGVLLCGSGIGVSMVANRYSGIRAALVRTTEEAALSRQHNDANVLCMGARLISLEEMMENAKVWLETDFEEGRHSERIALFDQLGERS